MGSAGRKTTWYENPTGEGGREKEERQALYRWFAAQHGDDDCGCEDDECGCDQPPDEGKEILRTRIQDAQQTLADMQRELAELEGADASDD